MGRTRAPQKGEAERMTREKRLFDSSRTRVGPAFGELTKLDPLGRAWLGPLLQLASRASTLRLDLDGIGSLIAQPKFEYGAAPPVAYLRWLLNHTDALDKKR